MVKKLFRPEARAGDSFVVDSVVVGLFVVSSCGDVVVFIVVVVVNDSVTAELVVTTCASNDMVVVTRLVPRGDNVATIRSCIDDTKLIMGLTALATSDDSTSFAPELVVSRDGDFGDSATGLACDVDGSSIGARSTSFSSFGLLDGGCGDVVASVVVDLRVDNEDRGFFSDMVVNELRISSIDG